MIRVFQISKELNIYYLDIIEFLKSRDIVVENHMSSVDENVHKMILDEYEKDKELFERIRIDRENKTKEEKNAKMTRQLHSFDMSKKLKTDNEMRVLLSSWRFEISELNKTIIEKKRTQSYKTIDEEFYDMDLLEKSKESYRKAEKMLKGLKLEIEKLEKRIKEKKRTQSYKTIDDETHDKNVLKEEINLYWSIIKSYE